MISLVEFKKLLGEKAYLMSDEDIESLRQTQYYFANVLFKKWSEDKLSR